MLNILKLKLKNSYKIVKVNIYDKTSLKKIEPNVRNWKNSIYSYNKKNLSLIPEASKLIIILINGYFNLYSLKLVRKLNKRLYKKLYKRLNYRRYYSNKIFISDGQFKHTNDLVDITIFFYNRQLSNHKKKLGRKYFSLFKKDKLIKKLKFIKKKGRRYLIRQKRKNNILIKSLKYNNISKMNNIKNFKNVYYRRFIKKSLYRIILYIYYRQLIFINEYKFNNYYLQGLTYLIKKILKKNIIFNFVNVKYFYLNSDIFTQSLTLKIRKSRRKVLKFLNLFVLKSKIKKFNDNFISSVKDLNKIDTTDSLLYDNLFQNNNKYLKNFVFNNLKYKRVSGIRLHLGGRLTRRNTASRSISKNRIKGSLVNLSSSKYGKSYSLLRGTLKSNIDYTNINSKVRNGTFGVKGWISGC